MLAPETLPRTAFQDNCVCVYVSVWLWGFCLTVLLLCPALRDDK